MEPTSFAELISGDELYKQRARLALPILVRQAEAGKAITYSDLAEELGMPNPRNLNYPLGTIGSTIENVSHEWGEKIPPIQCLVVNKNTGLPGDGVAFFLRDWGDFAALPRRRQKEVVAGAHALIFAYPWWEQLLRELSLEPARPDFSEIIRAANSVRGDGESHEHRALKIFVAKNPECIGLPVGTPVGCNEVALPSGDCLDVAFDAGDEWVAAEVKSARSDDADVVRGLFQCVKYRAVMEAVQAAQSRARDARAVLVLERPLPRQLISLRNILGIEVFENIRHKKL
ncbi:MAG: hypothetical protein FD139_3232 [Methylocystaceae bacterium]|nr:MAG: hypothetical protein FD172_2366 [Methylocystaceae bacterium]TXT43022.1 MAG: hypothetical protein FD139_3232 [Methylocystaceae bacterium]